MLGKYSQIIVTLYFNYEFYNLKLMFMPFYLTLFVNFGSCTCHFISKTFMMPQLD